MFTIPPHIRKYFLTQRGREKLLMAGTICTGCVYALNLASQTFFIDKYRDFVHLYRNGLPTPVAPEIVELGNKVLDDFNFTSRERLYFNFFSINGFDLFYLGSIKTRLGAYVGIPWNYTYKTIQDVERSKIMIDTQQPQWHTEGGQLFQESLVLSQDAQKFGIARQAALLSTYHIYLFPAVHSFPVFLYTFLAHFANNKFYGLYKPMSFRIFVYSLVSLFCYGIWTMTKDKLTKYYENKADLKASSLGKDYAKGGVEFYAKMLQKNMALRLLMKNGENKFTMYGNESEMIREKHVPLTVRKENVEKVYAGFLGVKEEKVSKGNSISM